MSFLQIGLAAFAILSAVVSQIVFKYWVNSMGSLSVSAGGAWRLISEILKSPLMLLGLVLYGLGFLAWLFLLSRAALSLVYPVVVSLNILAVLAISAFLFKESITILQLFGVLVVLVGIFLVLRV